MATVLFDDVVRTDYGQFDLIWGDSFGFDGDYDRSFSGQVNGLAGAASGDDLYLNLARRSGGSSVRIVHVDEMPAIDPQWEDIVEVSITVPEGREPRWSSWAGVSEGRLDVAPGTYRVRVSATGRDAGQADEFADGVVDKYLVELWPAATAPDAIIRTTTADAEYWHREVGGRR